MKGYINSDNVIMIEYRSTEVPKSVLYKSRINVTVDIMA